MYVAACICTHQVEVALACRVAIKAEGGPRRIAAVPEDHRYAVVIGSAAIWMQVPSSLRAPEEHHVAAGFLQAERGPQPVAPVPEDCLHGLLCVAPIGVHVSAGLCTLELVGQGEEGAPARLRGLPLALLRHLPLHGLLLPPQLLLLQLRLPPRFRLALLALPLKVHLQLPFALNALLILPLLFMPPLLHQLHHLVRLRLLLLSAFLLFRLLLLFELSQRGLLLCHLISHVVQRRGGLLRWRAECLRDSICHDLCVRGRVLDRDFGQLADGVPQRIEVPFVHHHRQAIPRARSQPALEEGLAHRLAALDAVHEVLFVVVVCPVGLGAC
mmetsp:Transcript_22724/g.51987  ORF Transcript_22724/g.51987 Transcript_22724/m.51987 type:complete len:328 (+) Transcript_22724:204-1187(+)